MIVQCKVCSRQISGTFVHRVRMEGEVTPHGRISGSLAQCACGNHLYDSDVMAEAQPRMTMGLYGALVNMIGRERFGVDLTLNSTYGKFAQPMQ